jgi:hypothetical protein
MRGYRQYGEGPRQPVEWCEVPQTRTLRVSTEQNKLFDIDTRGWDQIGFRFTSNGLEPGDSVTASIESPEGAVYTAVTMNAGGAGSGQSVSAATADILDIQSSRYVVAAILNSAGVSTECTITVVPFLKGGSNDQS